MRKTTLLTMAVVLLGVVGGCIVNDELSTVTIQPDGSADWVKFQSNIRSTEQGSKGVQELKKFVDEFDSHKDSDQIRITEAGGEVREARWVRREVPYANLVVARFPTAAALENFFTVKDEKGVVVVQTRFTINGNRRRLSFNVPVPRDQKPTEKASRSFEEVREQQANGFSETRLAIASGQIIASQGFTVASDKRSALLDPAKIDELLQTNREQVELFLEWE
ncbi:MAG: hypothetical protein HZA46_16335 [Planctomycetales bacterium]|nr:hypothetical protein [Planctomycetales bacterium]